MSERPLVDAWRHAREQGRRPLQIPGHKNRYSADEPVVGDDLLRDLVRDDIPLQGGLDDNAMSGRVLPRAEELWSDAVAADHCRFLVGGSSAGVIAALSSVAHPGRPVAVDRTSHRSAHAALVITGARPVWIAPDLHPEYGIPIGVPAADLDALAEDVTAAFVTSPSYVGTLSDVRALAASAHRRGYPLVVDQAWGAHLGFLPGQGAMAQGADVSVVSVHKALMGYSQTAVIALRGDLVGRPHLDRCVDLVQTTSPSGTMLASIDATRDVLARDGGDALARTVEAVAVLRERLRSIPGVVVLADVDSPHGVDPFKVTMWLPRAGIDGVDLGARLWELGLGVEAADHDTLVMTLTPVDDAAFLGEVADAVVGLSATLRGDARPPASSAIWAVDPEVVITPRDAFFAARRRIPLVDAVGEVSAEQFCPYPPGVPLLAPGERVTRDIVEAIHHAGRVGRVAYSSDPSLETIEVVDDLGA